MHEMGSVWVAAILDLAAGHHIYMACITGVEVVSVITRRARCGDIAASDAVATLSGSEPGLPTLTSISTDGTLNGVAIAEGLAVDDPHGH